jgi:hypothetical protein
MKKLEELIELLTALAIIIGICGIAYAIYINMIAR